MVCIPFRPVDSTPGKRKEYQGKAVSGPSSAAHNPAKVQGMLRPAKPWSGSEIARLNKPVTAESSTANKETLEVWLDLPSTRDYRREEKVSRTGSESGYAKSTNPPLPCVPWLWPWPCLNNLPGALGRRRRQPPTPGGQRFNFKWYTL